MKIFLDTGIESEVISGCGWRVTQCYNVDSSMCGAFKGKEGPILPVVITVMVIDLGVGSVALIGFSTMAWDGHVKQKESLLNLYIVWNQGFMMDDKAIHHGGEQYLKFMMGW